MNFFNELVNIHNFLYPYENDIIRIENNEILEINNLFDNFFNSLNAFNVMEKTLDLCAKIICFQPFYDGNCHTTKYFLCSVLTKFGYFIEYDEIKDENIIPLYYSPYEYLKDNHINKLITLMENKRIKSRS